MPTPRPETSDTWRAVEKPGVMISARVSASLSRAAASMSPFSTARARTASTSSPRPSSVTWISTLAPEWRAERWMVAVGFLPAARRASGDSMPWSMLLRIRCTSGSFNWSMTVLSSSVSAPSTVKSTSLCRSTPRSCTSRRNRSKVARKGSIRMLMEFSRSAAVTRSTASETSIRSGSSWRPAISLSRACTVTSSPTRLTSSSSLPVDTRRLADRRAEPRESPARCLGGRRRFAAATTPVGRRGFRHRLDGQLAVVLHEDEHIRMLCSDAGVPVSTRSQAR